MPAASVAPVETLEVTSPDGTRIGCEVLGEGPPLLAVHGSAADRSRWSAVRDALAARFRLHLMDRRGRGLSRAEAPGPYSLQREADDVRAVVGAIGAPALVLAHSYGATCALAAAADCPGIDRLLAYEPVFGADVFPRDALPELDAALACGDRDAALEIFFRRGQSQPPEAIAEMRATPLWQARLAAVHTLPREARAANAYRPHLIGPALRVLVGTESPPRLQAPAQQAAQSGELRELPGHAHAAMDTGPALFVAEVEGFFSAGRPAG
jgi:pimeloyl-ACP methyl ester carboxylesterase